MSHFQQKITRHTKKKKKHRRKRFTETTPENNLMANILDKDYNTTVSKILKEWKEEVK